MASTKQNLEELAGEVRSRIIEDGDPIGFLLRIMRGESVDGAVPTLKMRMDVSLKLMNKVIPDLRAVDTSASARADERNDSDGLARLLGKLDRFAHQGPASKNTQ